MKELLKARPSAMSLWICMGSFLGFLFLNDLDEASIENFYYYYLNGTSESELDESDKNLFISISAILSSVSELQSLDVSTLASEKSILSSF